MQGRNWIILAVAAVVGLFAVIIANGYFSGIQERNERLAEAQRLVKIAVASQPLEFGTKLTDQNVKMQAWPASSVPVGAFVSIPAVMKDNRVALRPMVPGEPVLASKVSGKDGRATLAAVLPEGMRAVSIPIGAVSGVAGFVLPGTTVDVILTRKMSGEGATSEDFRSDVILESVQVLAVDQLTNDKQGKPKVGKTATVAVTIHDAQRLSVADRMGALSLALRKVEDAPILAQGVAVKTTSTVTGRQVGGPRLYIGRPRESRPQPSAQRSYARPPTYVAVARVGNPGGPSGPSMTVVRGTQSTDYPITYGGW